MGTCNLCPDGDNDVPDPELLDHLRVMHPDASGDGPKLWPDGGLVIIDRTAETVADVLGEQP